MVQAWDCVLDHMFLAQNAPSRASRPLLHAILLWKNTNARGNVLDAQYNCSQVDIQYQHEAGLNEKVPVPTVQSPKSTS